MNWLAHLLLTQPKGATRLGGILPDFAKPDELKDLSEEFQRGIKLHREIDSFTDAHPIFRQSKGRISQPNGRFSGALIDIFYDHFLAQDWATYTSQGLQEFVDEVHQAIDTYRGYIPRKALPRLEQMKAGNHLYSYREVAGVSHALQRIGERLRRPEVEAAISELTNNYDDLHQDFSSFFPQLQTFIETKS